MTITEKYRECFKEYPVGTKFTRKQIIDLMQQKFDIKPASIIPSDYSYNMTNKGKNGSAELNNFFLNIGNGKYEYVGEYYGGMAIEDIVAAYKADFERIDKEERYKWEAIGWYKSHWDIETADFAGMFSVAFSKASNLLAANMYYPYKVACEFAENEPETVRALFKELYDERVPLGKRYDDFRDGFKKYLKVLQEREPVHMMHLNHYQDLHAVSVYLTFEFPGTYYLYKAKVYNSFKNLTGYVEDRGKVRSVVWKIENCNRMCSEVWKTVKKDQELLAMSKKRLTADCFRDEEGYLLAMDVVFLGSQLKNEIDKPQNVEEEYWPSSDEYNTGMTKEVWLAILKDSSITSKENLVMFKRMIELGGESTCAHLADVYGRTHNYYNLLASRFCERVKIKEALPDCLNQRGENKLWPVAFIGKPIVEDGNNRFLWKIRDELEEALEELDLDNIYTEEEDLSDTDVAKNTILYGPPGTGKTYSTVIYAVAIIEKKTLASVRKEPYEDILERFNTYKKDGFIESTTFHQSYGYEEFIEGIRPVMESETEENEEIRYDVCAGIFKKFCECANLPVINKEADIGLNNSPTIWKVSLDGTYDNPTRTECLENGHIRIGWDEYGPKIDASTDFSKSGGRNVLNAFIYKMKIGDVVLSCYSNTTIDAVGIVTGEYEWCDGYENLKRLRNVKWIVKGIHEDILAANGGRTLTLSSVYRLTVSLADVMAIIEKYRDGSSVVKPNHKNYVFIIDEINRGNISKIFGELITLIETSKRVGQLEETTVILPYSQRPFGVPDNVYLIGTMNTADRSIAAIDTALRRRFHFREMQPDAEVLENIFVEDLSIRDMFVRMNKRISVLYDREHTIGHAYFLPLKKEPTIETLADIFANNIIPLLQEYFYEDYEKIRLVLGDNNKKNPEEQFIIAVAIDYRELFGNTNLEQEEANTYQINYSAFDNIAAYRSI
ncbi:AAA family ATPase [Eisenbergiella tayi]|uniref:5-methylcytosine-specific restriction enzyme B n=1 Tax=Eisenbergiella tayi TaxID=1432052 RepID=A0A1E3AP61_9FIRM|nr:AAA family ATPase [Eisenbergiella tayi]ODM10394.1 5-methylcytosine-specific restriction enzyme B [Eisenbergiella tayi]